MIRTKEDLCYWLQECAKAYDKPLKSNLKGWLSAIILPDYNYEFMRTLGHLEYHSNGGGGVFIA